MKQELEQALTDPTWYRLLIPESELSFDSFEKARVWQEVAAALLRKYTERYYTFRKREWELPHLEYRDAAEDDANFPSVVREGGPEYGYRILIEASQREIVEKLRELIAAIEAGDPRPREFRGIKAIWFDRHVYQPLLFLESGAVETSPAPLNQGERRFVEDLKAFHDANPGCFESTELYLLRNLSKGRGLGFFEAGNFHPDFILWLLVGDRQHVVLDSFIVSNTPSHVMRKQWGIDKPEMVRRHILFQEEDKDSYIGAMLGRVTGPATRAAAATGLGSLKQYRYPGCRTPFGAHLRYLIQTAEPAPEILGILQYAGPAWRMRARDRWIGRDENTRWKNLRHLVGQSRFLLLPRVHIQNPASQVVGQSARRLAVAWHRHYGFRPLLLETPVDERHYRGARYRAANWRDVRRAAGGGRMNRTHHRHRRAPKPIFWYLLVPDARPRLAHVARKTVGTFTGCVICRASFLSPAYMLLIVQRLANRTASILA